MTKQAPKTAADDGGRPSVISMLGRLRWSVRGLLPTDSPIVMAQAFAYLYGLGATLVLLTLLFPHDPDRFAPGLITPALLAYAVAALMVIGFDRIPLWLFRLLPGLGAVLITSCVYSGGPDAAAAYATIYFWAVLSAYYFFDMRNAAITLLVAAVGFAGALAAQDGARDPELSWFLVVGTLTVAGMLISLLRQRSDRLVALLGEAQSVAHIGSWEWHIPSDEVVWSGELYRIHGLEPGESPSSYAGLLNHVHPSDRQVVDGALRTALLEPEPFDYEHRIVRPDGIVRFVQSRGQVATDDSGRPLRMFGTVRDVTERKRADVLRQSFVPERLPDIPGLKVAARFVPGGAGVDIGGDWYDVVETEHGKIGIAIGDVAGRGIPAASLMAQLRNALRAYAFEAHAPATALEHLNRLAWIRDGIVMATLIYLVLDPDTGRVQLSSAGHLPPLHLRSDGTTEYLDGGRSVPLGVSGSIKHTEAEYVLDPGSTLLLYTDGLVEKRTAAIDAGLDQLAAAVSGAHEEDLERLCDRLLAMVGGAEDDVALLAIRPTPIATGRLELTMPAEPTELGSLRRALRRWLEQCDAGEEESYDIIVACNEACANAIEHAYGPGDASVRIDAALAGDEVAITVRDCGRWREARADGDGRGLHLIETLMDSVDIVSSPQAGTEVSMTRRIKRSRNGA